jgi:hypothetical protein
MEDEDFGVMDPTVAGGMLSQLSKQYATLGEREAAALQQVEQSRAARLRAAEERIRAMRFGAPSSSEQLFALSSSMLAPMPYKGLAGTLSNLVPTLGKISSAKRNADESREEALLKLREGYDETGSESALARTTAERKGILDLMRVYGPLAKPKGRKTGFNPIDGRLQDMDTGEEIETPQQILARVPPQAIKTLQTYLANPAADEQSKVQAKKNFEARFGVPARAALGGK